MMCAPPDKTEVEQWWSGGAPGGCSTTPTPKGVVGCVERSRGLSRGGAEIAPPYPLAADLGLTILRAARIYGKSVATIRQLYVWGAPDGTRIGRSDVWNVWWADPKDLQRVFGQHDAGAGNRRTSVQNAFDRRQRLRAQLQDVAG
jgi:hypothetical protein